MGGCALFNYGVDIIIYIAGNVAEYIAAWFVVYFGGWIVLYVWGVILPVAPVKIFPCNLAFVCNWWLGLLFLCGVVWRNLGYCGIIHLTYSIYSVRIMLEMIKFNFIFTTFTTTTPFGVR